MTIFAALLIVGSVARADTRPTRSEAGTQQVEAALAKANDAIAAGKRSKAEQQLRAALQRHPGEALLLLRWSELVMPLAPSIDAPVFAPERGATELLQKIERAHQIPGDRLAAQNPESERRITLHAALAEGTLGRFEQAFAKVVEVGRLQDKETVLCLRQLAVAALRRDKLMVAEQALGLARQYVPQDPELAGELGRVLLARGKTGVAVTVFSDRFAVQPTLLSARADLAFALAADGRPAEGVAHLNAARDACIADHACALLGGRIALEAERPVEALEYTQKLASERDLDALYVQADAKFRSGDLTGARQAYQQILAIRPESVRAKQGLEQLDQKR